MVVAILKQKFRISKDTTKIGECNKIKKKCLKINKGQTKTYLLVFPEFLGSVSEVADVSF
jgi:hypothetical protein